MELVSLEKRRSLRWAPEKPLEATLIVKGHPYEALIFNYGFGGFGVQAEQLPVERLESVGREVEVVLHQEKFFGKVSHAKLDKKTLMLGIRLPSDRNEETPFFTTDDPGWDLIEDAETIATVFADVAFKGPETQMEFRQKWTRAILLPVKLTDRNTMLAEIHELSKGTIERGAASIQFEIFQTCHAFESRILEIHDKKVELELPKRLARLLRRETVRIQNGANSVQLTVRLVSKALGPQPKSFELYDFSEHGISVLDDAGWISAPIGVKIEEIEVTTPEGTKIIGQGSVASRRWIREKEAFAVGLEFHTGGDPYRTLWHNVILHGRYPTLSFEYTDHDHDKIWDLFERSDYLHLKGKDAYTHVMDLTRRTWVQLAVAGTSWSKRAILRLNETIVGHIQMDQIYPGTWCVHHLAIDPKISKMVAKELYAVTTDVLLAEGGQFVFSFTEATKPWNQRSYYDFVGSYRFPEHNALRTLQIYEALEKAPPQFEPSPGISIHPANRFDLKRVIRYFELYDTSLEREACALTSVDPELKNFGSELKKSGLERGREFLVATQNGRFLGFSRLETASAAVNIVGILDILYLHLLPELGAADQAVRNALIEASLKRFSELGRSRVLLALDDNRSEYYSTRGLSYVCDANRWIARRDILPRYHAFSQLLYGHLTLKRERIRKKHSSD